LDVKVYVDRVRAVMDRFKGIPDGFTVAVMGCEVNGPREAASAKLGVAGSTSGFVVFVEGRPIGNWPLDKLEEVLSKVVKDLVPGAEER
jgi:(E)-4-hydroxy-3-methylbut-2-enyl-diphosphate synthase